MKVITEAPLQALLFGCWPKAIECEEPILLCIHVHRRKQTRGELFPRLWLVMVDVNSLLSTMLMVTPQPLFPIRSLADVFFPFLLQELALHHGGNQRGIWRSSGDGHHIVVYLIWLKVNLSVYNCEVERKWLSAPFKR